MFLALLNLQVALDLPVPPDLPVPLDLLFETDTVRGMASVARMSARDSPNPKKNPTQVRGQDGAGRFSATTGPFHFLQDF